MPSPIYPTPPSGDQVDDYHGTLIADPFRPLEDTDTPATRSWIAAQNELTGRVLGGFPARRTIRDRLVELWDHPRAGAPWRRGDRWFQLRNAGLQDQDVLWASDGPETQGRVLLDPNGLGAEGTTALSPWRSSESGELVAIATSEAGSDWRTWSVRASRPARRCPTGSPGASSRCGLDRRRRGLLLRPLPGAAGGRGLDAPNRDMELRYHRLGTDAADDTSSSRHRTSPSGASSPRCPTTAACSCSASGAARTPRTGSTSPTSRTASRPRSRPAPRRGRRPVRPHRRERRDALPLTDSDAPLGRVIAVGRERPRTCARDHPGGRRRARARGLRRQPAGPVHLHHAHHRLAIHELDGRPWRMWRCPVSAPSRPGGSAHGRRPVPHLHDLRRAGLGPRGAMADGTCARFGGRRSRGTRPIS